LEELTMSEEKSSGGSGGGGGFGWFILGGLVGLAAGAYIASGPGRSQVDSLRSKTIELSASEPVQKAKAVAQRARVAVTDPDNPVGKAIQDGVAAAKRRREELEAAAARKIQAATNGEDAKKGSET
jgi:hypothetical protein